MLYETDEDRRRQDVAAWLFECDGFEVTQSQTTAPWDFALRWNGEPYALVEYKYRKKQYDPYKIDCEKIDSLISLSADWGVKPVLMVDWQGVHGRWIREAHKNVARGTLRRLNRAGEDEDEVYCIPLSEFKKIGEYYGGTMAIGQGQRTSTELTHRVGEAVMGGRQEHQAGGD